MTVSLAPSTRLTVADYDEILAAGTEAMQTTNLFALKLRADSEQHLFHIGALVDDDGRQIVVNLLCLGYPRTVAMRIALQAVAADDLVGGWGDD